MEETKRINGEDLTLEQTYLKNKRIIYSVANKLKRRGQQMGFDLDDLVSAGKIGFIQAYERFDDDRNVKFMSFARPYVYGYIMMEIRRKDVGATISLGVKEKAIELIKTDIILKDLTVEKVMDALDVDYKYAYEVFHYLIEQTPKSMESPVKVSHSAPEDGEKITIGGTCGKEADFSSIHIYENRKLLTEKERIVYDLMAQGYTQTDIQHMTGLKRTTINMRVREIRQKLYHLLEEA